MLRCMRDGLKSLRKTTTKKPTAPDVKASDTFLDVKAMFHDMLGFQQLIFAADSSKTEDAVGHHRSQGKHAAALRLRGKSS